MAAAKDPDARPAFIDAALAGELAVATQSRDQGAPPVGVPLQDGRVAAAVFTAPERVAEVFGPEPGVLLGPARQVLHWLRNNPVVLNPGTAYGVVWSPSDLEMMLDGVETQVITKDTKVMLRMPAERPDGLIDQLTKGLTNGDAVSEAYLMLAHRSDQPEPTLMLGIAPARSWDEAMAAVTKALTGFEFGDMPLDLMQLDDSPLSQTLRTGIVIVQKS